MIIQVQIKQVYGREMIYPVNDPAHVVCFLTGRKTMTRQDIDKLKQLGHTIEVKQEITTL